MKILTVILAIVTISILISIIDAVGSKQFLTNLFPGWHFKSFLEPKRQESLFNKYIKLRKVFSTSENNLLKQKENDEDNYARTYIRRKVIGIADNPF
ncbi:unnamed protein product [Rotaria sordida]|uniref:Uncharacterized protein n=1 Tax=Rotaria sordida TaxID=392033 RepID=A0A814JFZ8_9BILA|nr:unnamed protein product [Rotaria sordida]